MKQNNPEKIFKSKQYKAPNKEIWFDYLAFMLGNIQKCMLYQVH